MGFMEPSRRVALVPVTIAAGASLSGVVELKGYKIAGIIVPANWTTAIISFQSGLNIESPGAASPTYVEVVDDTGATGTVVTGSINVGTTGLVVAFRQALSELMTPLQFIKVRSGTNAAPVNQTNQVTLQLICVQSSK